MIFFNNTDLKVYRLTSTATGLYGETERKYIYSHVINVDFQNENNNEIKKMYGVEKQNMYKIYMDITADLEDTDRLKDAHNNCYEIVGEIREYAHFHKYKKVNLIKLRKGRGSQ